MRSESARTSLLMLEIGQPECLWRSSESCRHCGLPPWPIGPHAFRKARCRPHPLSPQKSRWLWETCPVSNELQPARIGPRLLSSACPEFFLHTLAPAAALNPTSGSDKLGSSSNHSLQNIPSSRRSRCCTQPSCNLTVGGTLPLSLHPWLSCPCVVLSRQHRCLGLSYHSLFHAQQRNATERGLQSLELHQPRLGSAGEICSAPQCQNAAIARH